MSRSPLRYVPPWWPLPRNPDRTIRVGISARYLNTDEDRGLNRYTVNLIKALRARHGVEFVLLTHRSVPVHPRFVKELGCPVAESNAPSYLLWEQVGLPRDLKRQRLDLLHVPADDAGTPQWKPCPVVSTCHLYPDKNIAHLIRQGTLSGSLRDYIDWFPKNGWRSRLEELRFHLLRFGALRAADRIITISEFAKKELRNLYGVPEERIRLVYEAPAPEFFETLPPETLAQVKARYQLPAEYLLFVGGFDRRKNTDALIPAYAALRERGLKIPLLIVAEGGQRQRVENRLKAHGLEDPLVCRILQAIHGTDLAAIYQGASIFVTLSWYETFCFPVAEAMASGLPIVASSFGSIPEIMGDAGIAVDPRQPGQAAQALEGLLKNRALRQTLGQRARIRAQIFSWERTAEQTWAVYEELLQGRLRHL